MECSGHPSPAWMESFESIHDAARLTENRVQFLVETNDGFMVSVADDQSNVQNRMGAIYLRPDGDCQVGEVIKKDIEPRTYDGTKHRWTVHFKLVRAVDDSEVQALAGRSVNQRPRLPKGRWFEAVTD